MANITDTSTINLLDHISTQVNRYITLFVLIFGIAGNSLTIFILSQKPLRSIPCVLYFLGSSVSSLGIILVGISTRFIDGWISKDPTNTNALLCKLRIFLLYGFRTTSVWLIVLATADRWILSSTRVTRRFLSSHRVAYKCMSIVHFLSFLLWAQSLYCYDTNLLQAPIRCYGMSPVCRIFNDVVYACSTVLVPSFTMLVFGLLTIKNINRVRRIVQPYMGVAMHGRVAYIKKNKKVVYSNGSLTAMLLLQVLLLTLFSLPQAIHQLYLTFTIQTIRSPLRGAIENFVVNFDFSLTYIGNSIPFYIYTLSGKLFRKTLLKIILKTYQRTKLTFLNVVTELILLAFPQSCAHLQRDQY